MFPKVVLAVAILFLALSASAQTVIEPQNEAADKLEKEAVSMLRQTLAEVDGLRLVENRISFASELASLMWFHDAREARSMYGGVISDFRQLLTTFDAQMNMYGAKLSDEPDSVGASFMGEPTDRQKVERKFRVAVGVRQTIATGMAEHDPELALVFYYDSLTAVGNPDLRRQMESGDRYFEQRLLEQLAAIDPSRASEIAKRNLERGINSQQVEVLKKLYAKDVDKAIDLAASLLARIKSEKLDSLDVGAVSSLLKFGTQVYDQSRTVSGKKPVFTDAELREIADILAQAVLVKPNNSGTPFANYAKEVERFQPGRAIQIRAKVPARPGGRPAPQRVMNAAARTAGEAGSANARAAAAARALREQSEKRMMDDVMKIGSGKLTPEQRDKIITQARATIMSTPGREKRLAGLSMLATQVARAGDKDLAGELMRDAASILNPQPKNYKDFMLNWLLVAGYASVDPDKAFPLLEDSISRANDLIGAAIKIGEFIDVTEEVVSDGELQVGAFGGSMVRSLTKELGMADGTIELLARADFQKMRDLTNLFDRPEVRVLAKMMVLRAVLKTRKQTNTKSSPTPM